MQIQMDCDICFSRFDDEKIPKILSRCGHTLCSECVSNIQQKSGNVNVQCPHCRLETRANDIRTNFALLGITGARASGSINRAPHCSNHAAETISVFCVKCGLFICKDCFDVSAAPHAGHERMQLNTGIRLVAQQRDRFLERIQAVISLNQEVIRKESIRIKHANGVLANMAEQATQHFTNAVGELKAELDSVLQSLAAFQRTLSMDLESADRTRIAFEEMTNSIPESNDIPSLIRFTEQRELLETTIEQAGFREQILDDLDNISLEGIFNRGSQREIALPKLTVLNAENRRLFSLELPTGRPDQIYSMEGERPVRTLHRSTSNDRLRR